MGLSTYKVPKPAMNTTTPIVVASNGQMNIKGSGPGSAIKVVNMDKGKA